jgi:hypothetical protein
MFAVQRCFPFASRHTSQVSQHTKLIRFEAFQHHYIKFVIVNTLKKGLKDP